MNDVTADELSRRLPVDGVTDFPATRASDPVATDALAPRVVLLVEDEDAFRELLETVLRGAGYVVHAARDGRVAARLLAEHTIHIIVTDLCMPGTDGMEFLTKLRMSRCRVPIIAMSGGVATNLAGMLRAAQLLGAQRTLEKPFSLPQLTEAVREVLAASKSGGVIAP